MIRNEKEYQEASVRLMEERTRLADHRIRLREAGLSDVEIKRVIDPSLANLANSIICAGSAIC